MCGIVAIIAKNGAEECSKALNRIIHRGTNGTKIIEYNSITIGFNRLAINDLSNKGMQPFEFEDYVGVFNGEIFNTKNLAQKYEITLKSKSDIEIILPLFKKFGSEVINILDGFYSGVIYNKKTKKLFTLRDYIGKKPLFWGKQRNFKFISSELKAFPDVTNFSFVPKGFSEINDDDIINIKPHRFQKKTKETLKESIKESVLKRLKVENDQTIGVFLSGGLDSSIIASIVASKTQNVIYYTLGSPTGVDGLFVKKLAQQLKITSQLKYVPLPKNKDHRELIENIVYHTESYNPSIISNGLASYLLSKKAKEDNIKVVLSGEGADELFCGYKIAKSIEETRLKSNVLINNLHFTELRRLDLASMANTIEARCPFLDKQVYCISQQLSLLELKNKQILRDLFKDDLPDEIVNRRKISLDVGSGIRKLVFECLTINNKSEREALKEIWELLFFNCNSTNKYYFKYPVFDKFIDERGPTH